MAEFDNLGLKSLVFSMAFFFVRGGRISIPSFAISVFDTLRARILMGIWAEKKPRCARLGTSRKTEQKFLKTVLTKSKMDVIIVPPGK